jgi:hypothetical protein
MFPIAKIDSGSIAQNVSPVPRLASYAVPAACFAGKANCKLFLLVRKQVNIQVWLFPQKTKQFQN